MEFSRLDFNGLMNDFEHFYASISEGSQICIALIHRSESDTKKSFFRPLCEPINSTTIDQRREHSQPRSEDITERTHTNHQMDVLPDSTQIALENVHLGYLQVLGDTLSLANWCDALHIFCFVQIRNVTRVKNVVDILEHLFVDDLRVHKEEASWLILNTCLHQHFLDIISPIRHSIAFNDFDLLELVTREESSEAGETLSSRSTDSEGKSVSKRCSDNPSKPAHVVTSV